MAKVTGMKVLFAGVVAAIAVTAGYGFYVAGSPSSERGKRADQQKVDALMQTSYQLDEWYRAHRSLPENLDSVPLDPYLKSGAKQWIEYEAGDKGAYRLCATFSGPTTDDPRMPAYAYPVGKFEDRSFRHEAGHQCFDLKVASVGTSADGCSLMVERKTGKVGCFGCTGNVCDPAPADWAPFEPGGAIGIDYACFAGDSGCELAQ